jgi:ubiquinone/menaquinone biosynthesis C-methylase UbiE
MGYSNFEKTIKEAIRILKPKGKLYINEIVIRCNKDKLSKKELDKLNYFIDSWFYNVFDIQTIINKMNIFDEMKLIYNSKFVKPSINWINAVRNSELKKYHNSKLSNIPPLRGADFLYRKYK